MTSLRRHSEQGLNEDGRNPRHAGDDEIFIESKRGAGMKVIQLVELSVHRTRGKIVACAPLAAQVDVVDGEIELGLRRALLAGSANVHAARRARGRSMGDSKYRDCGHEEEREEHSRESKGSHIDLDGEVVRA